MIRFSCLNCTKSLAVNDSLGGKRGKCPSCGQPVTVPLPAAEITSESDDREHTPDPLIAIASSAATSVASAAGSAASALGGAVTGWLAKRGEKKTEPAKEPEQTALTTNKIQPSWIDAFTRDNQSPDVVQKVAEKISGILMSEENLTYIAVQNKPIINWSPDCIALTSRRFIFYRPKLLGRVDFEDYVWRDLHDAKLSENVIGSTISVRTSQGRVLALDYLPKSQARAVYRIAQEMEEISLEERRNRSLEEKRAGAGGVLVQTHIGAAPTPSTIVDANDPLQTLQKLKTMCDAGLISTAEYEAKKNEILSRM